MFVIFCSALFGAWQREGIEVMLFALLLETEDPSFVSASRSRWPCEALLALMVRLGHSLTRICVHLLDMVLCASSRSSAANNKHFVSSSSPQILHVSIFKIFIYLFMLGCVGSFCCCEQAFSSCVQASHCGGFSCCGASVRARGLP